MRLDAQDRSLDTAPSRRVTLARIATAGSDLIDELSNYGFVPGVDNLADSIPAPPP